VLAAAVAGSAQAESVPADPVVDEKSENIAGDIASRNAEIVRRSYAVMSTGDINAAVAFMAEDARNFGRPAGREGFRRVLTDIFTTFPDWRVDIVDLDAVGDDVVIRAMVSGTHKGVGRLAVNGGLLVGVPPTGKSFKVQHIHWNTLKNGLIVEHWANRDDVGMMRQLGLLPPVASATPKA
jgi:steroid delta-isomerase-like uncharacterized protein